jgi:hypothetical protein
MTAPDTTDETAFDLRARAELALAFDPGPPGAPPAHLLRHTPWHARSGVRRLIAALLVGSSAATAVFAMRPPELVRAAIEHDGTRAYHLTTFFEKGGIVTVLAFEQPQRLSDGQGWWDNMHWKVVHSREGRPLVLVAQKKQALAVASKALGPPVP